MENERERKLSSEYDGRKTDILNKYHKKSEKICRRYFISSCLLVSIGIGSTINRLTSEYPQHTYLNNQQTIRYLRQEIAREHYKIPEFVSDEIISELEKASTPSSEKYSALEKSLALAKKDSAKIVNSPEYSEHKNKDKNKAKIVYGTILALFALMLGLLGEQRFRIEKPKFKELDELKKYYER